MGEGEMRDRVKRVERRRMEGRERENRRQKMSSWSGR